MSIIDDFMKSSGFARCGGIGFIDARNPTTTDESRAISFLQLDNAGNILPP